MCLRKEPEPILRVEVNHTTSIALNHAQIAHKAITRNICLDGSQYRALGQDEIETEDDRLPGSRRTVVPALDEIEGAWDDEDDS